MTYSEPAKCRHCRSSSVRRALLAWLGGAALAPFFAGGPAAADQVITPARNLTDVSVVDLVDGDLHLRSQNGEASTVPIQEVERLLIDSASGMSDLNDAERYASDEQYDKAITRYERALRLVSGFWAQVIRIRLFQVCDRAGKYDKSAFYFLELVTDSPVAAAKLFPQSIPEWPSKDLRSVAQRLESSRANAGGSNATQAQMVYDLFAYAVMMRSNPEKADRSASGLIMRTVPPEIATEPIYRIYGSACRALLERGEGQSVLKALDRSLESCPEPAMPGLLILKGEALLAQAKSNDEQLQAGLAFMRVPVHFPDDPRAAVGLFQTALVYERIGNLEKAGILMAECMAHSRVTAELKNRAEEAIKRFSSAGTP